MVKAAPGVCPPAPAPCLTGVPGSARAGLLARSTGPRASSGERPVFHAIGVMELAPARGGMASTAGGGIWAIIGVLPAAYEVYLQRIKAPAARRGAAHLRSQRPGGPPVSHQRNLDKSQSRSKENTMPTMLRPATVPGPTP